MTLDAGNTMNSILHVEDCTSYAVSGNTCKAYRLDGKAGFQG